MTNDDLKRFYQTNAKPEQNIDFVRYDKSGKIQSANPIEATDVVTLQYLQQHGGGSSVDLQYSSFTTNEMSPNADWWMPNTPGTNSVIMGYTITDTSAIIGLLNDYPMMQTIYNNTFLTSIRIGDGSNKDTIYLQSADMTTSEAATTIEITPEKATINHYEILTEDTGIFKQQGSENAGKVLTVGSDGNVVLQTIAVKPTTETLTVENTLWVALSDSSPYTYAATLTATTTIGADSIVELINNQAVLFATYGFAIGGISGQTITIYSIGQPSENVTLTVEVTE